MKAIIEFDLDEQDDRMAHLRCVKALDMALVLSEFSYNTRKAIEYTIEGKTHTDEEVLDLIYKKFYELLEEYSIIIDDLVQ